MAVAMSSSLDEVLGEPTTPPMVWRKAVRIVVRLCGEQDRSTAANVAHRLAAAARLGEGDVVVDLSEVEFIDVGIVRVLIQWHDLLWLQARHLTLRAPSRFVARVLDLCGLVAPGRPASTVVPCGIGLCVMLRGPG